MRAIGNDAVLAESDETIVVEGNHYSPADSIPAEFFGPSETHTVCGWEDTARYYDIVVGVKTNKDAARYYPAPKDAVKHIAGCIALWRGVGDLRRAQLRGVHAAQPLVVHITPICERIIAQSLVGVKREKKKASDAFGWGDRAGICRLKRCRQTIQHEWMGNAFEAFGRGDPAPTAVARGCI